MPIIIAGEALMLETEIQKLKKRERAIKEINAKCR